MLFVMALILDMGTVGAWKVRTQVNGRYAAWRSVAGRSGQTDPNPWGWQPGSLGNGSAAPVLSVAADWDALRVITRVDGEVRQDGVSSDWIFDVPTVLTWITAAMTLLPGDVVLMGTPEGVGPLEPGQTVEVEVPGVGTLRSPVVAHA